MRNSTKMGGAIKKKYQTGGSKLDPVKTIDAFKKGAMKDPKMKMNPAKIKVGSTKTMDPVARIKAFEKMKSDSMLKKQNGGVIPEKPIVTSPIQERTGRRPIAGGNMAKGGQTFPDLNKDGKVTQADVLKGRGVYKKGGQAHPGFKAVQAKIAAKSGVSKAAAGAILAASTRKASAKAKAANPRLKRVKG